MGAYIFQQRVTDCNASRRRVRSSSFLYRITRRRDSVMVENRGGSIWTRDGMGWMTGREIIYSWVVNKYNELSVLG
jgi:transposase